MIEIICMTVANTFWLFFLVWEPRQRAKEAFQAEQNRQWSREGYDSIEDFYFWNHVRSYGV
jgi:hypothetical protein